MVPSSQPNAKNKVARKWSGDWLEAATNNWRERLLNMLKQSAEQAS